MNLIFSADDNWGIGKDNQLLFRTKGDMAFFRRNTLGKVIVMGRKTLESLPGGKPLKDRTNIVLTRTGSPREDVIICRDLPSLFEELAACSDEDILVIGGAEIYRQLMPYSRRAIVTRFHAQADADSFVPNLDHESGWRLAEQSEPQEENGLSYDWRVYENESPLPWRK